VRLYRDYDITLFVEARFIISLTGGHQQSRGDLLRIFWKALCTLFRRRAELPPNLAAIIRVPVETHTRKSGVRGIPGTSNPRCQTHGSSPLVLRSLAKYNRCVLHVVRMTQKTWIDLCRRRRRRGKRPGAGAYK